MIVMIPTRGLTWLAALTLFCWQIKSHAEFPQVDCSRMYFTFWNEVLFISNQSWCLSFLSCWETISWMICCCWWFSERYFRSAVNVPSELLELRLFLFCCMLLRQSSTSMCQWWVLTSFTTSLPVLRCCCCHSNREHRRRYSCHSTEYCRCKSCFKPCSVYLGLLQC